MVCTREAPLAERVLSVLEVLLGGQRGYNINLCTKLRPALLQALQRVSVVNTDHGFEQEYSAQGKKHRAYIVTPLASSKQNSLYRNQRNCGSIVFKLMRIDAPE